MIGRKFCEGDDRPNDGRYRTSICRLFFNKMSSIDHFAIFGRLTPDEWATDGQYHDVNVFKKSPDATLHQCQNPLKSADQLTKLLSWVLMQHTTTCSSYEYLILRTARLSYKLIWNRALGSSMVDKKIVSKSMKSPLPNIIKHG